MFHVYFRVVTISIHFVISLFIYFYFTLQYCIGFQFSSAQSLSSVQFSRSVMTDSLGPHESQHARPPCPSPSPGVHSDSHPSSPWCHPAISFSVIPFSSCPQSLPASKSFPMSQLFAWGGQSMDFQLCHHSFQGNPRADLLRNGLVGSPCSVPGNSWNILAWEA